MPTWSDTFETALAVEPGFSPGHAAGLLIAHGGALLLASTVIPWFAVELLALCAVGASLCSCCRHLYCQTREGHLARLVWSHSQGWVGYRVGYPPVALDRISGCFVSPWVVQLRFQSPSGHLDVVLARDALPPDVFRRLRARLLALTPHRT